MRIFRSVLEAQEKKWLQNPLFLEAKNTFMQVMEQALEGVGTKNIRKGTNYIVVMWIRETEISVCAEVVASYNQHYVHLGVDQTVKVPVREEDLQLLDSQSHRSGFTAAMYKGLRKYYEALGGIPVYHKDLDGQSVIVADISGAFRQSA